jgi:glutaredoxin-like protein
MSELLNESIRGQVKDVFDAQLKQPVEVLFFGSSNEEECAYCNDTRQLVEEVIAISDKLHLSVYDLDRDSATAQTYQIDKTPALVIAARNGDGTDGKAALTDYGIRYSGLPSGHEFSSLIHSLILASTRDSGLKPETRHFLKTLSQPIHLQVFVTPSCPYCPAAVLIAHRMAIESPFVKAEMVEATEFPELSNRFNVSGVPQTTINAGAGTLVGAAPEEQLTAEIMKALALQRA